MHKIIVLIFVAVILSLINIEVECGVYGRGSGQIYSGASATGGKATASKTGYIGAQSGALNQPRQGKTNYKSSGLSAWGIITIVMFIILTGAGAYYGIICYPLFCKTERSYDTMDDSTTTGTPTTRSSEFEKSCNYSSRSTTPAEVTINNRSQIPDWSLDAQLKKLANETNETKS